MPERLVGTGRARAAAGAVALGAAAAAVAACDPCAGVVSCEQAPRVGVSGQVVDRGDPSDADGNELSGQGIPLARPVAGVQVEVIPTGGAAAIGEGARATTDGSGWWQVSLPARDTGAVVADVVVTAPGTGGYRVRGVTLRASGRRGDGTVLGRWTHRPYVSRLGEVIDWPSGARRVGTRVTAVRRGGVEFAATRGTRSPMVTVPGGRFLFDVRPAADGPLVLDFLVERDGLPPATVRGVTLAPQYEWLPPNVDGALIFYLDDAGNPP